MFWLQMSLSIEPWNKNVEKIILKIWVQNEPSSIKVESSLLHNPQVKNDSKFYRWRICFYTTFIASHVLNNWIKQSFNSNKPLEVYP
jgi:hypothetical protein